MYQVGGNQNPPSCQSVATSYLGKVRRDRTPYCSRGYFWNGTFCYLANVDPAKNLGPPCPSCGNPIAPGTGNKFQREVDYQGGGEFPLTFVRYYNSQQRINDSDQGYYGFNEYFTRFGNDASYALASKQGRIGHTLPAGQERRDALRWTNLGIDSIGANWRHTYQRSIYDVSGSASGATSATAFRHDGRVLSFIEHNGAFYSQADISDRLMGSAATGWTYVSPRPRRPRPTTPTGASSRSATAPAARTRCSTTPTGAS